MKTLLALMILVTLAATQACPRCKWDACSTTWTGFQNCTECESGALAYFEVTLPGQGVGYTQIVGVCQPCPSGCLTCDFGMLSPAMSPSFLSMNCTQCLIGYAYNYSSGGCAPCSENCENCGCIGDTCWATYCLNCSSGYSLNSSHMYPDCYSTNSTNLTNSTNSTGASNFTKFVNSTNSTTSTNFTNSTNSNSTNSTDSNFTKLANSTNSTSTNLTNSTNSDSTTNSTNVSNSTMNSTNSTNTTTSLQSEGKEQTPDSNSNSDSSTIIGLSIWGTIMTVAVVFFAVQYLRKRDVKSGTLLGNLEGQVRQVSFG